MSTKPNFKNFKFPPNFAIKKIDKKKNKNKTLEIENIRPKSQTRHPINSIERTVTLDF
jgi:hypothetical protein